VGAGYRYAEILPRASRRWFHLPWRPGFDHQLTETTKIVDRSSSKPVRQHHCRTTSASRSRSQAGWAACGYQVRHNTDVLPGVEKTDTLTTVGLLYETK
jgi:hypothetical protein